MSSPATVDIGTLIVSTPGVVGGSPRIAGSRISVKLVADLYNHGFAAEQIAERFDHISLNAIYAAITYYLTNKAAVDAEIEADDAFVAEYLRTHPESRTPPEPSAS